MKVEAFLAVVIACLLIGGSARCAVGGRAPSPSPGVATATPAVSEMAPARPLDAVESGGGAPVGEDGGTQGNRSYSELPATPASTVTQSALTQEGGAAVIGPHFPNEQRRPTVTASPADGGALTPSAVPATPVTSAWPVDTLAPKSDISALIAASPWPQSLWGTVACLIERESKGNAGAIGKAGERGLMQVHPITWPYLAQYGIMPDALFDPATNLRAGYLLFIEAGGLRPWNGGCA